MPLSLLQTLRSYLLRSPILLFLGFVALVLPIVLLRSFQSTVHFGARQDNAPRVCVCPMVITASTMQIYCLDGGVVRKWGFSLENDSEDYSDSKASSSSIQTDAPDDYDSYEINELEDATRKTYHCAARNSIRNETNLDRRVIEVLDNNGIPSLQAKRLHYQVRSVRQKMCQAGFNPFQLDRKGGSVHRRFKNTIRLMIYNTPGMFPGLRLIRSDLDRKRKREPQNWFRFELTNNQVTADFDYDNYFVTIYGDFGKVQAYSKLLVTLKMHKRLNNFNDSISSKINLDLGIMEVILSNFGTIIIKEKSMASVMVKALNGIRTELSSDGEIQIEFEDSAKEALDQINPLLYSVVWLQSMAEKYEVVKVRDKSKSPAEKMKKSN